MNIAKEFIKLTDNDINIEMRRESDRVMNRAVLELHVSIEDKKLLKELEEMVFQFNEAGNIDENDVLQYLGNMINNGKITLWELNIKHER